MTAAVKGGFMRGAPTRNEPAVTPATATLKRMVEFARRGRPFEEEEPSSLHAGIAWYWVGQNASHSFYLGIDPQGNLRRAACGCEIVREGDPDFSLDQWVRRIEGVNEYARRCPTERRDRYEVGIEALDGRLSRYYLDYARFRVSPDPADPRNPGYLGHL